VIATDCFKKKHGGDLVLRWLEPRWSGFKVDVAQREGTVSRIGCGLISICRLISIFVPLG
jgi:hypothetical protein